MLTETQLSEAFSFGREQQGIEFKGPGPRSDRHLLMKVVRAMLGMANRRDGGHVVIGVENNGTGINPVGLSTEDLASWTYDSVADVLASYAEPPIDFDLRPVTSGRTTFVVIDVREFNEVPIVCRRDFGDSKHTILREGAMYTRPRRKPETVEVSTYPDMRDLIDLATEKGVRRFLMTAARSGVQVEQDDSARRAFDDQVSDFI
jgi:predicted HTH transcriptional regulator